MAFLDKHKAIETHATLLLVLSFLVVTIGGLVQIVPLFYLENTIEKVEGMRPYAPLELAGRNIYIREGCYVCHSQMIRPFRDEVERYGDDKVFYLMARPGITGLWQISGRNDIDYDSRVALDCWYVRNWSLWYDIVILIKTIKVVLARDGAY